MEKHESRKNMQNPDEAIITYPKTVEFPDKAIKGQDHKNK